MKLTMRRFGFVLLGCCINLFASAQEIKVTSGFVEDSVAIGEPVSYYLTARYPERVMALFPDSTYRFTPFEFSRKKFFPTKTTDGISYDSAVYTLSTFEIDPTQFLSLPVYVTTARDCTAFESDPDSIYLIEQIKIPAGDTVALKNLTLKSNTLYERVRMQFNTVILMIVLGVLVLALGTVWTFYGKKIIRYFKVRKLEKNYQKFVKSFNDKFSGLTQAFSPELAEQTLFIWKGYMEGLTNVPMTKYSTREIKMSLNDPEIIGSLESVDRMVYGRISPESLRAFEVLRSSAEKVYRTQINSLAGPNEIKSGTLAGFTPKEAYTIADIQAFASIIRQLPCPVCKQATQPLNGNLIYTVYSFLILTTYRRDVLIACPVCLNKAHNRAILKTVLLGWWGFPWGLIKAPQYVYLNLKAKKQNKNPQATEVLLTDVLTHVSEINEHQNDPDQLFRIIKRKN